MSIAATVGAPIITGIPACIHDGFVAIQGLRGVDPKTDMKFKSGFSLSLVSPVPAETFACSPASQASDPYYRLNRWYFTPHRCRQLGGPG